MNKKQKTEKCREILYKNKLNESVNDEDKEFLISIFENHSEWGSKKGVGIKSISVINNSFNKCFQINRIDGSFTDISFVHSISNQSKVYDVKKACRNAIQKEVQDFRDNNVQYGVTVCPFSKEILNKDNTHVDHYNLTFNEVYNLWIQNHDFDVIFSKINKTSDNSVLTFFTDKSIDADFLKFHNANSNLRAVSKNTNLSTLKLRNTK